MRRNRSASAVRFGKLGAAVLVVAFAAGAGRAAMPSEGPSETPAPQAGIPEALAKVGAGDFAGAAKILEGVTAREPKNVLAWRYLGFACLKVKDYARARSSYEKVLALAPGTPQAFYNLGVIAALQGTRTRPSNGSPGPRPRDAST